jgi:hypothetical protein
MIIPAEDPLSADVISRPTVPIEAPPIPTLPVRAEVELAANVVKDPVPPVIEVVPVRVVNFPVFAVVLPIAGGVAQV